MDLSLPLHFFYGLGVFLFGMSQLEKGIRKLSDARLQSWLQSRTATTWGSIASGAVTTALLQSSSMVSLLVLAFASAGLLPLVNAIGVILGANLGTTATGWLVATIGFKLELEAIALPLMGISAFVLATIKQRGKLTSLALIGLGLGLLLFGLSNMKDSMEAITAQWDVTRLQGYHSLVYLLCGFMAAFLVQSSSAVMMMALSALSVGLIPMQEAVAFIIGADLGTTSTTILASLSGGQIKKKLALSHCVFNFVVDIGAYLLLLPFLPGVLVLVITEPLYQLVAFHSVMNLIGLLLFAPVLGVYAAWIDKFFGRESKADRILGDAVPPKVVDVALYALLDATRQVVLRACINTAHLVQERRNNRLDSGNWGSSLSGTDFLDGYEYLKRQEGEILQYSWKIQEQALSQAQVARLQQMTEITRAVVYSNKTLKDIRNNLLEFSRSSNTSLVDFYQAQKTYLLALSEKLERLLQDNFAVSYVLEELDELARNNQAHFQRNNELVYSLVDQDFSDRTTSSSQLNVNREIYFSIKSLVAAVITLTAQHDSIDVHSGELQPS